MGLQLKQRVVGAAVLVALGVILIPIFLDDNHDEKKSFLAPKIESMPVGDFNSRVVPLDEKFIEQVERAMDATPQELIKSQHWTRDSHKPATPSVLGVTPRTGITAWVIQLGSFSTQGNAETLAEKLRIGGYTAFIEQLPDDSELAYRVRVGPELTKEAADKIRDQLAKELKLDGIVIRYP
ncbi:MAG TPA: hypothetical protein DGR97_09485 [Gammaproteobacteria bacterium]|nr:hypothetical protein [Gammaproteobacteria bacterium]|tara:strand:+ start:51 stop:593 length:543 start_codon:yes stop_codon:yes gene_type:complete